jgi:hypothetical protein
MANQNLELNQFQEQGTEGSRPSTASSSRERGDQQSLSYSSDEEEITSVASQQQSGRGLAQSMSAIALGNHPRLLTPTNPLIMRRVQSGPDSLIPLKHHRTNSPPLSPSRGGGSLKNRSGLGTTGTAKGPRLPNGFQDFQSELNSLHKQLAALTSSK